MPSLQPGRPACAVRCLRRRSSQVHNAACVLGVQPLLGRVAESPQLCAGEDSYLLGWVTGAP